MTSLLAAIPELDPADGRRDGRLLDADCDDDVRARLYAHLRNRLVLAPGKPGPRLFDASPRNARLIPFLRAAFPDAAFVYVHRHPADTLPEALALWRSGRAATYPDLPGWTGPAWSFMLVDGWRELIGHPLAEIVTEQWVRTMRTLIADLELLPPRTWCVIDHNALLAAPAPEIARLFGFLGIERQHAENAGAVIHAPRFELTQPERRAALDELRPYASRSEELAARAGDWIAPQLRGP